MEDEMVGWHHQLDGQEFEQAPGAGDGQGGLACCSPWGCKELDTTEQLNGTDHEEGCWMGFKECMKCAQLSPPATVNFSKDPHLLKC